MAGFREWYASNDRPRWVDSIGPDHFPVVMRIDPDWRIPEVSNNFSSTFRNLYPVSGPGAPCFGPFGKGCRGDAEVPPRCFTSWITADRFLIAFEGSFPVMPFFVDQSEVVPGSAPRWVCRDGFLV